MQAVAVLVVLEAHPAVAVADQAVVVLEVIQEMAARVVPVTTEMVQQESVEQLAVVAEEAALME
jgi:hypothetical protein